MSYVEDDPDFRRALDQRAEAWRAQQAYLVENDETSRTLEEKQKGKDK